MKKDQNEIDTVVKALEIENNLADVTTQQLDLRVADLEPLFSGDPVSQATLSQVIDLAITLGAHCARVQFLESWLSDNDEASVFGVLDQKGEGDD